MHHRQLKAGSSHLGPESRRGINRDNRAFTLVESIMAVLVFTMVMLGVYATMAKAHQLSALSRYQDNARAVLMTFADQFVRLQTTEDKTNITRSIFTPTTTANGTGTDLQWGSINSQTSSTSTSNLTLSLGGDDNGIPATVTRIVKQVSPDTGQDVTSPYTASGYLLRGTFTVSYSVGGKPYSQSLTVVRAVP